MKIYRKVIHKPEKILKITGNRAHRRNKKLIGNPSKSEVILKGNLVNSGNQWFIKVNGETYHIMESTDKQILAQFKPGAVTASGMINNKEDNKLDAEWDIQVTEIKPLL